MQSTSSTPRSTLSAAESKKLREFMEMTCTTDESASIATLSSCDWDVDSAVETHVTKLSSNMEVDEEDDSEESEDDGCYMDSDYEDDAPASFSRASSESLFPKDFGNVTQAIERFSEIYQKRYKTSLPLFKGTFRDALKLSKESGKPLLMLLMNDNSIGQNVFCTHVLGNQNVQSTICSNFILFAWDSTENMGRLCYELDQEDMDEMAQFLKVFHRSQVEAYPLLVPVIQKKEDLPTFCQSSDTVDGVLAKLISSSEESRMLNRSAMDLKREREERDLIRRLQEEEYQASLAADLAKIEKMKQEEAEKKMTEEKKQKELEEAERIKNEELARQEEVAKELPSEPAATEPGIMTVKFRLPEGKQLMRRFRQAETIQTLIQFLDSQGYSAMKYKYFNSDFPKKNVLEKFDSAHSFIDAKWPVREQIFVEEI